MRQARDGNLLPVDSSRVETLRCVDLYNPKIPKSLNGRICSLIQ